MEMSPYRGWKKIEIQLALWDWVEMRLVWDFAQRASKQEKFLAWQVNLLVQDEPSVRSFLRALSVILRFG